MPAESKKLLSAFTSSLTHWGGIMGKCVGDSSYLTTPLKPNLASNNLPPPNYREKPEQWRELVPVIGAFTNAFLIQELDRISDGPGSMVRALSVFEDPAPSLFLMALVLVSRDNGVGFLCEYLESYGERTWNVWCRLAHSSILELTVKLRPSFADCRPDFLLELSGTDFRVDPNDSSRKEQFIVERGMVVQCDRDRMQPRSNDLLESDMFIQELGYPVFQFSSADILQDAFGCASRVFKNLVHTEIVTDPN